MKQYNILYVDDEPTNLRSFEFLFRKTFTILTAESGQEGLAILENTPIHLIISDQRMPNMTGVEFLRKVKEKWPEPKIILLTGFTDNEAVKEAVNDIGIYWYANKPFDPDEMGRLMRNALHAYGAERERESSEKKLRKIMDTAIDGIITIDDEYKIVMANPAVSKIFGYSSEELIGESMSFLVPDFVYDHDSLIENFGKSGDRVRYMNEGMSVYGKGANGEHIPIETVISKMELDGKRYYNAIIRDIRGRLKGEAKLKAREEEFKDVLNSMVDVFARTDMQGNCLMISPSIYEMTGFKDHEIIGKPIAGLYFDQNDRFNFVKALQEQGVVRNFITELVRKDGEKITVSSNSWMHYNGEGQPIGAESIVRDITASMNAEKKLKENAMLFRESERLANLGIWQWHMSTDTIEWSDELFRIYGVDKKAFSPTFKGYLQFVHPEDRQRIRKIIEGAVAHRQHVKFEERIVRPDGTERRLKSWGTIVTGDDGDPTKMFGTCLDITEMKEAELKIRELNEDLEQKVVLRTEELVNANDELRKAELEVRATLSKEKELGELKSRFVATASHQFRTPLTVIQSNIELLEMGLDSMEEKTRKKYEKSFERIKKEGLRMTEMMDDVLILGKINAGVVQPSFQWVEVAGLFRELTDRLNDVPEMKAKIRFKVKNQPQKMWLDEKLVSHLILNLLHNAQKYSLDRGDVLFQITFLKKQLKIDIQDQGIGMSEQDLENISQPFYRGGNAKHIPGTGLGMSIVQEYVLLSKGTMDIQSELNVGTRIRIALPFTKKTT